MTIALSKRELLQKLLPVYFIVKCFNKRSLFTSIHKSKMNKKRVKERGGVLATILHAHHDFHPMSTPQPIEIKKKKRKEKKNIYKRRV